MIEAMVDNETWGIRCTSVVRSVGIVVFEGRTVLEKHYFRIDEDEQSEVRHIGWDGENPLLPRTTDQSTVDWWSKPENAAAQATIFQAPLVTWDEGRTICGRVGDKAKRIWSKPGMFDLPMLRDLFGQDIWSFGKESCLSTLLAEFDPTRSTRPQFEGVQHNALDDAVHAHVWLCDLRDKIAKPARDIEQCMEMQCRQGTVNVDEYMRGMANGLILADSIVKGIEPQYVESPQA